LKPAQRNSSARPYLDKTFTKIGLVEWLKVKVLSSSPSTAKKKKKKKEPGRVPVHRWPLLTVPTRSGKGN
jgi:hypothetical protein